MSPGTWFLVSQNWETETEVGGGSPEDGGEILTGGNLLIFQSFF